MPRIWNVVRMHLVNPWTYLTMPWIIVGASFAMTLAIWMLLRSVGATGIGVASGTLWAMYLYLMLAAILSVNVSFAFALGFSATRRDFYLGTALLFTLVSAGNAVALTALAMLEKASGGWWLNGEFFAFLPESNDTPIAYWFVFFALQLFCCFLGAVIATVYMRWRMIGMVVFWVVLAAAIVGCLALVAYTSSWGAIGEWLASSSAVGLAAQSLVATMLAALAGFLFLRRATPKN